MGRLSIKPRKWADNHIKDFTDPFMRRIATTPPGMCPIALQLGMLEVSASQTCGKCTPCYQGIPKMLKALRKFMDFSADESTLEELKKTASLLWESADCAVGYQAGLDILKGLDVFAQEYESHIKRGVCADGTRQTTPCIALCPAHVNIPAYIASIREGKLADAIKIIREHNPFPTACAYICEHPCEERCRRAIIDEPLNIRGMKKYAVDNLAADKIDIPTRLASTNKRIAVIGGGPAGMTCAYFASLMGHNVSIFEAHKQLGGMMRYGIPAYRFPRKRLDEDIRSILDIGGIETILDHPVDEKELARIAKDFDAVYLAIGAQKSKSLHIEGIEASGVMSALELLDSLGDEKNYPDFTGKKVVVIGGGNVAMDCARTSVRAHAEEVSIVYRRRLDDMTALPDEIRSAMQEGVEMCCLKAPLRIEKDKDGKACALICQPQRISTVKHGRPTPTDANSPEERFEADIVLIAIGQAIDAEPFEQFGLKTERGCFVTDDYLKALGCDNIFAGGDCQAGPKTVIEAINAGRVAAHNIDAYLGFDHQIISSADIPPARCNNRTACGRVNIGERPARQRKHDFDCVELAISDEEAQQESERCLRCDVFGVGALSEKDV